MPVVAVILVIAVGFIIEAVFDILQAVAQKTAAGIILGRMVRW